VCGRGWGGRWGGGRRGRVGGRESETVWKRERGREREQMIAHIENERERHTLSVLSRIVREKEKE